MDLAKRYEEATPSTSVNISSLEKNKIYPIVRAKRINTKFESTLLVSMRDSEAKIVHIFLPGMSFPMKIWKKLLPKQPTINLYIKAYAIPPSYLFVVEYQCLSCIYILLCFFADSSTANETFQHTIWRVEQSVCDSTIPGE